MTGIQTTIYLRDDELKAVEEHMKNLELKRHQVIKLALRCFLFPKEVSKIPLDGAYAEVSGEDIHKRIAIMKQNSGDSQKIPPQVRTEFNEDAIKENLGLKEVEKTPPFIKKKVREVRY